MSLMMSASGFPCIEGDLSSPVHFWEEERKQAESDRRIVGFLSCCLLESSSARHAAPNSVLLEELALAILCDSPKGGWDLLLAPCGWVRRIQLSDMERVGISFAFSLSFRPGQLMTIG